MSCEIEVVIQNQGEVSCGIEEYTFTSRKRNIHLHLITQTKIEINTCSSILGMHVFQLNQEVYRFFLHFLHSKAWGTLEMDTVIHLHQIVHIDYEPINLISFLSNSTLYVFHSRFHHKVRLSDMSNGILLPWHVIISLL